MTQQKKPNSRNLAGLVAEMFLLNATTLPFPQEDGRSFLGGRERILLVGLQPFFRSPGLQKVCILRAEVASIFGNFATRNITNGKNQKNFSFQSPFNSFCFALRETIGPFLLLRPLSVRDRNQTSHSQCIRLNCWHEPSTLKVLEGTANSPRRGRGRLHRRGAVKMDLEE